MKRVILTTVLAAAFLAPAAASAEDERLQEALTLFQQEKFVDAANLFEQLNEEAPSNALRLNSMVAWYKGGRCMEAMAAWQSVDRNQPLESRDHRDLDTVEAYCQLQTAKAETAAGQYERALDTLNAINARHTPWQNEILALRSEIQRKQREPAEPSQPLTIATERAPTPAPAPLVRPTWARYSGLGGLTLGVALGVTGFAKHKMDQQTIERVEDKFRELDTLCVTQPVEGTGCSAEYQYWWETEVVPARKANTVLMVSGGVLTAAGAGLLLYYAIAPGKPAVAVSPTFGTDGFGAALSLQFQ